MNGAKFCWSFQHTRLPVVRSRCRNTLPGQVIVGLVSAMIVASRPWPDESIAVAPSASSNLYEATSPAPGLAAGEAATSVASSARP